MDVRVDGGEVQIILDLRDLEDILSDLFIVENLEGLEPRTGDFVEALRSKGVTI